MVPFGFLDFVLRGMQALWALVVTGLTAAIIHGVRSYSNEVGSTLSFDMFVAGFAWVAILHGLVARFFPAARWAPAVVLLDGLAAIFCFSSGVVSAYTLGGRDCGALHDIPPLERMCRLALAGTAFMWALFAGFAISTVLAVKEYRSSSGRKGSSIVDNGV